MTAPHLVAHPVDQRESMCLGEKLNRFRLRLSKPVFMHPSVALDGVLLGMLGEQNVALPQMF